MRINFFNDGRKITMELKEVLRRIHGKKALLL